MRKKSKAKPVQLHRVGGLVLEPMFRILGFATNVELELSWKRQKLDIVTVKKDKKKPVDYSVLPKVYWEAFDDLNIYNLISFKSYWESFNSESFIELYSHLNNYLKINEVVLMMLTFMQ